MKKLQKRLKRRTPKVSQFPYIKDISRIAKNLPAEWDKTIWESSSSKQADSFYCIHKSGRFSFLSFKSEEILDSEQQDIKDNPLKNSQLRINSRTQDIEVPKNLEHIYPFIYGFIGYVSYDCIGRFENIKGLRKSTEASECLLLETSHLLVVDHQRKESTFINWYDDSVDNELKVSFDNYEDTQLHPQKSDELKFTESPTKDTFISNVKIAKDYIKEGDIFQVVLSRQLLSEATVDSLLAYKTLKEINPSPFHFYFSKDEQTILGASPEVMLRGNGNEVYMRPVAGTFPRGATEAEDKAQAELLQNDEKERAEHLMLVDLERNDLGRVAKIGGVSVSELFKVETYQRVHHLVSQIRAELDEGESVFSALESSFPIGTLAGTPKIRAMEIISELEDFPRGVFGGAFTFFGLNNSIDSCVNIRLAHIFNNQIKINVGAGIVADSIPEREYSECAWKAASVIEALNKSVQ